MLFVRLETPQEIFHYKLGAAYTMEHDSLRMLGKLEEKSQREELKQQFRHHADETRGHVQRIEEAFRVMGEEPDESPCPVTKALEADARAVMAMASDELDDDVVLSAAAETEHHEMAVYESLITRAEELGQPEVVRLLQQNLEQELHTIDEIRQATREVVHQEVAAA